MNLAAERVLELEVHCAEPMVIGETATGYQRVIPIIGGSFSGPGIRGEVLAGGADWNTRHRDGLTHVFAKYTLRTEDGCVIGIQNEGWFNRDQPAAFIRTQPRFQVESGSRYAGLTAGVYVASLKRREGPDYIMEIQVFRLS